MLLFYFDWFNKELNVQPQNGDPNGEYKLCWEREHRPLELLSAVMEKRKRKEAVGNNNETVFLRNSREVPSTNSQL